MGRRNYYKTQYNRPNRKWLCGRARFGMPCPKGPTVGGNCPGRYECTPAKIEGRWYCTRPDPYGGPCDSPSLPNPDFGPMASAAGDTAVCCRPTGCTPERSLRSKRNLTVSIVMGVALGILLVGIGSSVIRDKFITPGLLTRHHQGASVGAGRIAEETNELNCAQCHHAIEATTDGSMLAAVMQPFAWVGAAFEDPPEATANERLQQNALCLECHEADWVSEPNFPHGLDPSVMDAYTERTRGRDPVKGGGVLLRLAKMTGGPPMTPGRELACATCHQEHQGRQHDLKVLSDRQCQVCHVQQFASFNEGHPEFPTRALNDDYTYPYRRRQRIIYDHDYHEKQQYTEAVTNEETGETVRMQKIATGVPPAGQAGCMHCHEPDHAGRTMQVKSFEAMCGDCHFESDILGAESIGVWRYGGITQNVAYQIENTLIWEVEGFLDNVEENEYEETELEEMLDQLFEIQGRLQTWPKAHHAAASVFSLPLIKKYYEGDDEQFAEDMRLIFDTMGGTLDEFQDRPAELYVPQARAVERYAKAIQRAESEFIERPAPDDAETGSAALTAWEDVLGLSVSERDAALGPFASDEMWTAPEVEQKLSGATVREAGWELRTGEPDAEEEEASTPQEQWQAAIHEIEAVQTLLALQPGGDDAEPIAAIADMVEWLADRDAFAEWFFGSVQLHGTEWRLANDIEAPMTTQAWQQRTAEVEPFEALKAKQAEEEIAEELKTGLAAFIVWFDDPEQVRAALDEVKDAPWYGLHQPREVFYNVNRHADPFLKTWLDKTGEAYADSAMARLVFDRLAAKESPTLQSAGKCVKCHSVDLRDRGDSIAVVVNWSGERERRQFTSFNHAPHLILKEVNCKTCHEMKGDDENFPFADSYLAKTTMEDGTESSQLGVDPTEFRSNFEGLDKASCMKCHTAQDAGNTCLVCHKYHVEDVYRRGLGHSLDQFWRNLTPQPAEEKMVAETTEAEAPAEPGD